MFEQQLLELWDRYTSTRHSPEDYLFQPTMTDFMEWIRKQSAEQEVKPARTERSNDGPTRRAGDLAKPLMEFVVKPNSDVEPSAAQYMSSDAEIRKEITRLYQMGHTPARIRLLLNLPWSQWSIAKIRKIGSKLA